MTPLGGDVRQNDETCGSPHIRDDHFESVGSSPLACPASASNIPCRRSMSRDRLRCEIKSNERAVAAKPVRDDNWILMAARGGPLPRHQRTNGHHFCGATFAHWSGQVVTPAEVSHGNPRDSALASWVRVLLAVTWPPLPRRRKSFHPRLYRVVSPRTARFFMGGSFWDYAARTSKPTVSAGI